MIYKIYCPIDVGDLMDIQNSTTIPEVKKTIVMLRELSADEKVRQEAFYREKRIHDEATALNGARKEGIEIGRAEGLNEMIEKMRKSGMSEEQIRSIIDIK